MPTMPSSASVPPQPLTHPLSGLASLVATDPQLRGVLTHLGEETLAISGADATRSHLIHALATKVPGIGRHRYRP